VSAFRFTSLTLAQAEIERLSSELAEHERYLAQTMELAEERKVAITRVRAMCLRYDEASRTAPAWPHVDSGRAWHWVAIDIRAALDGAE